MYHFVTGDVKARPPTFLPDREYGLALDALVKGCADVLITTGRGAGLRVLLGKRRVEPQPDWWFVGGRTRPGESPAEGAARNVRRELGLSAEPARFAAVGTYSFLWQFRAQPPFDHGTADVSTVFELALGDAEADLLEPSSFDADEYADAGWTDVGAVLRGDYHPALQQAVRDLVATHAYDDLRNARAARAGDAAVAAAGDATVAAAARRFVAWREAAPAATATVRFTAENGYAFVDPKTGARAPRPTKEAPPLDDTPPTRARRARDVARLCAAAAAGFALARLLARHR